MKLLGLSFGHVGGNCDIVLKQALLGAMEREDIKVSFLNTCHLNIDRCTGCGACDRLREKGGMSICVRKDDFKMVEEAIVEADAIIAAAPVYVLGPTGQYKNLVDRLGPSHDVSFLLKENEARRAKGMSEAQMIPEKYFKERPLGLISVGGARTKGWTSMGLSGMYLLGFPMHMVPVDALNIYAMGERISPVLDDALMERLSRLGRHVADALGKRAEDMEWMGDEDGVCPVCHCDQLTVRQGTTVECSVCGSIGTLSIENGEIKVYYDEMQVARSRFRPGGDMEHCLEIKEMGAKCGAVFAERGKEIEAKLEALKAVPELKKARREAGNNGFFDEDSI